TATGICTISGGTVTITSGTGNCVVHYNQSGNANYNAAIEITETTAATKVTPTLSVTNSPVTYNGAGHSATVSASALGTVNNILTGGSATQTNAGTYTVTANFTPTNPNNYNALTAASAGNFIINK